MPQLSESINENCALHFNIYFLAPGAGEGWVQDGPAFHFTDRRNPRLPARISLAVGEDEYAALTALCDVHEVSGFLDRLDTLAGAAIPEAKVVRWHDLLMPFLEWKTERWDPDPEWGGEEGDEPRFRVEITVVSSFLCGGSPAVGDSGPGMRLSVGAEEMRRFLTALRVQFERAVEQAGYDPDRF